MTAVVPYPGHVVHGLEVGRFLRKRCSLVFLLLLDDVANWALSSDLAYCFGTSFSSFLLANVQTQRTNDHN